MNARRVVVAALAPGGLAVPAAAHSPMPGIEGFYTGLVHPLSTPDQALALVALGLLLGGHALRQLAPPFAGLGLGLLAGLLLGRHGGDPAPSLFALAALAAALAALAPGRGRLSVIVPVSLGIGTLLGWASLPEGGTVRDRAFTISGSVVVIGLACLYLAGGIDVFRNRLRHPWLDILLRVLAAWLFAVALLMLALGMAPAAEGGRV